MIWDALYIIEVGQILGKIRKLCRFNISSKRNIKKNFRFVIRFKFDNFTFIFDLYKCLFVFNNRPKGRANQA